VLIGTGEPAALAKGAPAMERLDTDSVTLPGARVLQVLCEIDSASLCELLPPALHPTLPPVVSWLVYDCPDTPWGPTRLAQTRIECRSGTRPRGLLVSAICNNAVAGRALAEGWGYRWEPGEIDFRRGYDQVRSVVHSEGEIALEIGLREPSPLDPGDIQFVAGMHPVHTPRGFRLLQCDPTHAEAEAERGLPLVESFEAEAWGDSRIEPVYPVSAAYCTADITLPTLRYLCKADELAFTGTEKI
jgi:hypothetical protein